MWASILFCVCLPKILHYLCLIKKKKSRKEDNLVYANLCKNHKKKIMLHYLCLKKKKDNGKKITQFC